MPRVRSLTTALALALSFTPPLFAAEAPGIALVGSTPLPAITGGDFDHFAVDLKRARLYVAAEKYGSIEVFHLPDGQHLASVRTVSVSPRKIELARDGRDLMIADAVTADMIVADTNTFAIEKRIPLVPQPDSGVADERTGILYIGNGGQGSGEDSAYITLVSMKDGALLSRIRVPCAQVKAMAIDTAANRLLVNFRDKNQVGVIDLSSRKLVDVWSVPGPSKNSAMALDSHARRLFIGSRNPGKLFVMDLDNGAVLQSLEITNISDEIAIDPDRKRIYVAGQGGLDVVQADVAGQYSIVQHVDTFGGKTFAFIPELSKLYVVHTKGPDAAEAGLQIFDTK